MLVGHGAHDKGTVSRSRAYPPWKKSATGLVSRAI